MARGLPPIDDCLACRIVSAAAHRAHSCRKHIRWKQSTYSSKSVEARTYLQADA